ncbi:hypothetical protein [Saccharothrix sp. HUAS TT1]|uniref:hypothetical protein n=1 Tax=unclassified Saccharothrix TaxID=2593673 RepID=UPI00345BCC1D
MAPNKGTATRRVADALSAHFGHRFTADYSSGPRNTTVWRVEWTNGPTENEVTAVLPTVASGIYGYRADELRLRRNADERNLVAAWVLHHDPADPETRYQAASGARWQAEQYFAVTSFPRDLPEGHEAWTLADEALAAGGSQWHDADKAVAYLAATGVQALRIRRWLAAVDLLDRLRPEDTPPPRPPLDVHVVPASVLDELGSALAAVAHHLGGGGTLAHDPRVRVLTLEAVRDIVAGLLDERQLHHAMQAVADGTALGRLSLLLGLSRTTLGKRWPGSRADAVLRPNAWLAANLDPWRTACVDAAAAVHRLDDGPLFDQDVRSLAWSLGRTADLAGGWRDLAGTPEQARSLIAALARYRDKLARNPWALAPPSPLDPEIAAPLERLAALLADYDIAEPPRRRGGNNRPPTPTA